MYDNSIVWIFRECDDGYERLYDGVLELVPDALLNCEIDFIRPTYSVSKSYMKCYIEYYLQIEIKR